MNYQLRKYLLLKEMDWDCRIGINTCIIDRKTNTEMNKKYLHVNNLVTI